ncbi:MAG: phospholipid carrier-dependent glycosyltransferase [Alphaproteobacteria bacterium]|nr:phospholipid carrier-dependent glycosyltransferase [Alphaproteobacteria bacterium]
MTTLPIRLRPAVALSPGVLFALFLGAAAVRVIYVLTLHAAMGTEGLLGPDSNFYLRIGRTIAETGGLLAPADAGGARDQTIVMPLYPAWLALHHNLFGDGAALGAALSQAAIDAGTCVLIALIAREVDEGVAPLAGLLAALSPTLVILSGLIYTDSFFLFWSTFALYAGLRWLRDAAWAWAIILGLGLGLALSTRAVMLLWVPIVLALLMARAWWRGRRMRTAAMQILLAVVLCAAIQAPLLVRNWTQYGTLKLTSQGGTHALLWIVPLVREAADGMPHAAGARLSQQLFESRRYKIDMGNPFAVSDAMGRLAIELLIGLGAEPVLKAWGYGAVINLAASATLLAPPVGQLPRTGFYDMPGANKAEKIWNFLVANDNPIYGRILMISGLASALALLLTLIGAVAAWLRHPEGRFIILSLALWVAYILAVHGPVASPKYRLPAEPVLLLFVAFGMRSIAMLVRERRTQRSAHAR